MSQIVSQSTAHDAGSTAVHIEHTNDSDAAISNIATSLADTPSTPDYTRYSLLARSEHLVSLFLTYQQPL